MGPPKIQVMVESSDKTWSTGEGNGKPLQYACLENPMNSKKRQKDRKLKDKLPRSEVLNMLLEISGEITPERMKKVKVKSLNLVRLFATPWTVAHQALLSMGFSRREYWSGLPFPSPEDLLDPGIKPGSPTV